MPKPLRETISQAPLVEALPGADGTIPMQFISPGWGSSGHYSAEVLKEAADAGLFAAGTHMHLDHSSRSEDRDRPERSVRTIGAVLTEDGRWDEQRQAVVGPVKLMAPHAELIEALAPYIGLSISGSATDITIGTAEGRKGPIIEGLAQVDSIDFVTHAGRGGMVLLESARPSTVNALAIGHGIEEATANDTREQLQTLLRDAYSGDKTYVWVRDFDESTVWFEIDSPNVSGTYAHTYTSDDAGATALTGEATEVRMVTTYVPVTQATTTGSTESTPTRVPAARPDGTTHTPESEEDTMPNIQIEEAEHARLVETAGRATAAEQERDQLRAERDQLRARETAVGHARSRVTAANAALPAAAVERVVAEAVRDLPLTDAGQLDTAAFDTRVDEARKAEETYLASIAPAAGSTAVTGFGASAPAGGAVTETKPRTANPWGRPLTETKGA